MTGEDEIRASFNFGRNLPDDLHDRILTRVEKKANRLSEIQTRLRPMLELNDLFEFQFSNQDPLFVILFKKQPVVHIYTIDDAADEIVCSYHDAALAQEIGCKLVRENAEGLNKFLEGVAMYCGAVSILTEVNPRDRNFDGWQG